TARPVVALSDRAHRFGAVRDVTVGQAIILTNDGWIMLPTSLQGAYGSNLRLISGDEMVAIEEWMDDAATGMSFAKTTIEGTPATFGSSESSETGDVVFVIGESDTAMRLIKNARDLPVVEHSDVYERLLTLDAAVDARVGSFVANAAGSLIGVLVDDVRVRPLHHLTPAFDGILADGAIARASLGLSVIDEARVIDAAEVRQGMRVVAGVSSVVKVGDVILRVNGEGFSRRTLSEMVLAAKPSDELVLVILRDGTEHTVSVTLE
ncbi:MAG: S1C family serine protease, partial [Actinomycetota bacterium]